MSSERAGDAPDAPFDLAHHQASCPRQPWGPGRQQEAFQVESEIPLSQYILTGKSFKLRWCRFWDSSHTRFSQTRHHVCLGQSLTWAQLSCTTKKETFFARAQKSNLRVFRIWVHKPVSSHEAVKCALTFRSTCDAYQAWPSPGRGCSTSVPSTSVPPLTYLQPIPALFSLQGPWKENGPLGSFGQMSILISGKSEV